MDKMKEDYKTIGMMRLSALGDIIWTLPLVHRLKEQFPNARIIYFTSKPFSSVVEDIDGIEFITLKKPRSFSDYREVIKEIRKYHFDLFLCTQANLRVNLLYPFIRAKRKIGFDSKRGRDGHYLFVPEQIPYKKEHALEAFLGFSKYLGFHSDIIRYDIPIPESFIHWHENQSLGEYVCLHPKASHENRTWSLHSYIELVRKIVLKSNIKVILTGTNADVDFCEDIKQDVASDFVLNFAGKTNLKELSILFEKSLLVIAPDSGPIHLANAMGASVVGLYTSLPCDFTGPYGQSENCIDAYADALKKYHGKNENEVEWRTRVNESGMMDLISVDDVFLKINKLLKN